MKLNKRAFIALSGSATMGCFLTNGAEVAKESPLPAWLTPQLQRFLAEKEKQAHKLADELKLDVSPDIWRYLAALQKGDWNGAEKIYEVLRRRNGQYQGSRADPTVTNVVWQILIEACTGCEPFATGDGRHMEAFGQAVISSLPQGSIYFGGTDPGRGVITALCRSQANADPFFTITQNALADGNYLEYLRPMYGDKIYIPTKSDAEQAFTEYIQDAQKRLENKQLKPGEDVRIVDNRVQVSGQIAVMAINALLVKIIFDKNSDREFYIEESFPLDWMFPHLTPHGFIFKINRQPLPAIPDDVLKMDREFWKKQVAKLLGNWLQSDTPVKSVCEFGRRVFKNKSLAGFTGDRIFVGNDHSVKAYSKLRSAIGGVYAWRAQHARNTEEKNRMQTEADLAFRQALALCPYSPEAVFRYVNLLVGLKRTQDALMVALNGLLFDPENQSLNELANYIRSLKAKPE